MTDELEKKIFMSGYITAIREILPHWTNTLQQIEKNAEKAYEAMLKQQEEFKNEK